ncbi:hypothetical protein [Iodobacter fluviatilis]|jgi:hypothetical protein|uniref:hypothetical protein n=1 Tax=Iodobacter fluviatilis TaxID=537 RepID=UPI00165E57B9|nr:hypothetical protein [Iodobacter fluviatilis]
MKHIRYAAFASLLLAHAAIASVSVETIYRQASLTASYLHAWVMSKPAASAALFGTTA